MERVVMRIKTVVRIGGFTLVEMMVIIAILGMVLAIGTPPLIEFLRDYQASDAASTVMGVLRQGRARAIHERNDYIAIFDLVNESITLVDDDGGGNGDPSDANFDPTNRGNGQQDGNERVFGPYSLPDGQVFGFVAGTVDQDGNYVTRPVTFSGSPPRVIFSPQGSVNEEGIILVMPQQDFLEQEKGSDQMMIVRRSTGSVILVEPEYN
jgi:type II secretory pathway pseudopilin PulG